MPMKLYGHNGRGAKIMITAAFCDVKLETPQNFQMGVDNKTPEYLAKNPMGKVPLLETEEGSVFESNAIVRYVARNFGDKVHLYGRTPFEAAQIDQWIDFTAHELELPGSAWVYPIMGFINNNPLATKKAQEDIKKVMHVVDSHLSNRTYLVGRNVTIADIVMAAAFGMLYAMVLDPAFRGEFVNLNRWFVTIANQPQYKAINGEVKMCDKMAVAPAPKKAEKAPKEEKPKAEKAPKKEEKKPEPKANDDDEEDDGESKEPKAKNPLDALPKSGLVMDEWKRMYSNNDTRSVALPWFWEHYDATGYCMYWCDYKYNNELQKQFMTNNLIGGFFQRLETLHKYAFSSVNIYGEEGNLAVHGVWLFRGPEIPAAMKECDDSEVYEWTKVDLNDAAQKKKVEDFWAWEGEHNGKKFMSGKVYK